MTPIHIQQGLELARGLFWPRFMLKDKAVLLDHPAVHKSTPVSAFENLSEAEMFLNHIHILDWFEHSADLSQEPWWDQQHPDFEAACEFGLLLARAWAVKLRQDFAGQEFGVFYTRNDNPIVRFHKIRTGEPVFLDESSHAADIEARNVLILRTASIDASC